MTRQTYRGQRIIAHSGKGRDWGYITVTINGEQAWRSIGRDEDAAIQSARGYIDDAFRRPGAYPDHYTTTRETR